MSHVVVTGGASGVGEALVSRLVEQSRHVHVLDVQAPAESVPEVTYLPTDLSDLRSINQSLAQLPERIEALANVAGMARSEDATQVIAVNFLALRHLTEALTPRMASGGAVANVSSIAGSDWHRRADKLRDILASEDYQAGERWCREHESGFVKDPYTFSKRLATAYTLTRAQTFPATGVRVNCVSPGPIQTPLYPQFEALMGKEQSDWTMEQVGGAAEPDDIAQVLEYLLIGESRWLNGVDLPVDGGYTAGLAAGWIDFERSPLMQMLQQRRKG